MFRPMSRSDEILEDILPINRQQEVVNVLLFSVGYPTPKKIQRVIEEYEENANRELCGIRRENKLVGCIGLGMLGQGLAEIVHISVLPEHRLNGLGRMLIEQATARFALHQMTAETDEDARGFYTRCGFQTTDLGEKYPGCRRYLCTMKKRSTKHSLTSISAMNPQPDHYDIEMKNPWLRVSAEDYEIHMEHEMVRQGTMIREHLAKSLDRFEPKSLLYLGACMGNGLEGPRVPALSDILAVDISSEYLDILRERFEALPSLRTERCSFPEGFKDPGCFQLAYGALFFEYVDLESTLTVIGDHLTAGGHLVALLQQPSEHEQMTNTGVTALELILPIMSLHAPGEFTSMADRVGVYSHVSTLDVESPAGKPFCEIVFERS